MAEFLYWRHNSNVVSRRVGTETVIVRLPHGEMIVLNESAGILWDAADGTKTSLQLAAILAEKYGAETGPEIEKILEELSEKQLLVSSAKPQSQKIQTPESSMQVISEYAEPKILLSENVEAVAVTCDTGYNPPTYPDCQVMFPTCLDPNI